jgi:acyl-CoA synthetase (AMP-forming)/AMP-acid ligase II
MLLRQILARAVRLWPAREAVSCGERRFSYAELGERVRRLARLLEARGAADGARVAVLLPNDHLFLEAYHAAALVGAVLVPINVRLNARETAFVLDDAGCRLLLASAELEPAARAAAEQSAARPELLAAGADGALERALAAAADGEPAERATSPDDVAQLYYTSGTTGRPKGVMLSHRNVGTHALAAVAELGLTDADVWLHAAPMFHLADAWAVFAVTWVGGRHVMLPRFEARRALELLERERVTLTNLIPTMLNLLLAEPGVAERDWSALRLLLSGGAPIAPAVVRRLVETFRCEYVQTYGMTETSPYLTLSTLKAPQRLLPPDEQLRIRARTGRPFLGVELRVLREDGTEVRADDGEVGEIVVRGETVTHGYWRLPEETAQALQGGWLHTGDLATIDAEGSVNIVDRKKDMIITGGENVYSTEVEHVLYRHPAVLEAAVIGLPDERWGEAVHAVVALRPGAAAGERELIDFCRGELAHFKCPRSVELVPVLPRLGSGKLDKRALRERRGAGPGAAV